MKHRILTSLLIIIGFTSCEDYLDKAPELGLTEEDVFAEFESARGFLDQNYDMLEDFHNWDSQNIRNYNMTSLSDETASITDNQGLLSLLPLNAGQWLDENNKGEVGWDGCCGTRSPILGRAFKGLRVTNKVIANAEMIPNIASDDLNGLLGQAYFLRAWWYFQIIQRWGGMPIFDRVFSPNDDLDLNRLTYQESSEWLIEGLNKAIDLLPDTWGDAQYGRATKGSALGLRSMVALYAASPLMKNDLNSIVNNGYDLG
ncbi:MAG: RagB/SusD family nutrient uptake outer membrane protein, partial [Flavobacteriaceae bacterium]|nr:RagB/SusD family nutrient uptake outer membrane protein [Flavobacteriaceae bacterium]